MATNFYQFLLVLCLGYSFTLNVGVEGQSSSVWTHVCNNETKFCQRTLKSEAEPGTGKPLDVCKLNCNPETGSLFPLPTGTVTLGSELTAFYPGNVVITGYESYPSNVVALFRSAAGVFAGYLTTMKPGNTTQPGVNATLTVSISVTNSPIAFFNLDTDESYTLSVAVNSSNVQATITADNFFGARHALETLSQLIAYDEDNDVLQIVNVARIEDKPVYRYRGVSLDTSRNFISVEGIKRVIDGLSYNKMNMFHWHLTDTHSFPMEVQGRPNFTAYGAYSAKQVYSIGEMIDLVDYARARGVKIVPEFDEPAHTGFGWEWGAGMGYGELAVCVNEDPWYDYCLEPPCGQLNIVNENMYQLLGEIFSSMLGIFDNDLFHMGGDEVHLGCYNSSKEITDWMMENDLGTDTAGFMRLWIYFQLKAHEKLLASSVDKNMTAIVWSSEMTHKEWVQEAYPPQQYAIQLWGETRDNMTTELISDGYRVIFSNYDTLYLDCGFHSWTGSGFNWCSPYKSWQEIYEHSPWHIYANATNSTAADKAMADGLLLGGETPLWMEQADEQSFEARIWPRAAAYGERLWSNALTADGDPIGSWLGAEHRMVTNRLRMVARGVRADRLQPEFCSAYQGKCYGWGDFPEEKPEDDNKSNGSQGISSVFIIFIMISSLLFL